MGKSANEKSKFWYVARTRARQEKKIKEKLEAMGIDNYIPLREEIHVYGNGRKKKIIVPILPNLMFIHTDEITRFSLLSGLGRLWLQYRIDKFTHKIMFVKDKQMEDFIRLMESKNPSLSIENESFIKGDKVIVAKGDFAGVEGKLVEIRGKHKVLLNIEDVVSISVEIPLNYLIHN